MRGRVILLAVVVSVLGLARSAAQQPPSLETILERAGAYATRYLAAMSNLTAEERYVQDLTTVRPMALRNTMSATAGTTAVPAGVQHRELRSDIALLEVGAPLGWRIYRDVFDVDGRPVRDRVERLTKLFEQPAATVQAQAERIAEEGARFNVSNVGRVLNEPGLPIMFLQTTLQPRFQFTLDKRDGGSTWIVKYEESARPTLFRHNKTDDNPSSGRFWIDALTGEVTRTEHIVTPPGLTATFTTMFRNESRFGIAVPIEMQEKLSAGVQANARKVESTAKYSGYQRFQVTTTEGR